MYVYHEILMKWINKMYANKICVLKMIFAHFRFIMRILDDARQFRIIYVYSRLFVHILDEGCVQDPCVHVF